ncbi:MAG: flagellar biosynthesis anti-sigma factor FlgM [Butyricicoccus sp.]|nr:flagellar biosynthesis anti-sigma factor FlgM [Butyricicoccus sp.]
MMMIQKPGGITPLQMPRMQAESSETRAVRAGQYDRVELSACSDEQRFAKELAGRLSQQMRTHQSEELPKLKEQVQNGTYQYSIDELAVQIMLFGGYNT